MKKLLSFLGISIIVALSAIGFVKLDLWIHQQSNPAYKKPAVTAYKPPHLNPSHYNKDGRTSEGYLPVDNIVQVGRWEDPYQRFKHDIKTVFHGTYGGPIEEQDKEGNVELHDDPQSDYVQYWYKNWWGDHVYGLARKSDHIAVAVCYYRMKLYNDPKGFYDDDPPMASSTKWFTEDKVQYMMNASTETSSWEPWTPDAYVRHSGYPVLADWKFFRSGDSKFIAKVGYELDADDRKLHPFVVEIALVVREGHPFFLIQ
jgi:hypothetical protein